MNQINEKQHVAYFNHISQIKIKSVELLILNGSNSSTNPRLEQLEKKHSLEENMFGPTTKLHSRLNALKKKNLPVKVTDAKQHHLQVELNKSN